MNQLSNETRWKHFLSDLKPRRCKRPRVKQIEKDTLVGPLSISRKFATKLDQTFERYCDTPVSNVSKYTHVDLDSTTDDPHVVNTENEIFNQQMYSTRVEPLLLQTYHQAASKYEQFDSHSDTTGSDTSTYNQVDNQHKGNREIDNRVTNVYKVDRSKEDMSSDTHGLNLSNYSRKDSTSSSADELEVNSEDEIPSRQTNSIQFKPNISSPLNAEYQNLTPLKRRLLQNDYQATSPIKSAHFERDSETAGSDKYIQVDSTSSDEDLQGDTRQTGGQATHVNKVELFKQDSDTPGIDSLISMRMDKTPLSADDHEDNRKDATFTELIHSSQVEHSCSSPLKAIQPKLKPQSRPSVKIDDRATSVSKWDLSMFSKYVDFQEDVEKLKIEPGDVDSANEMGKIIEETLSMLQTSRKKPVLEDVLYKESNVRMFLTAIFQKVCMKLKFGLRTEEQINFKYLPTCKFDYLFRTHDGKPIGCMEAKTSSAMNSKAFAQAVIQLLVLQQVAFKENIDISAVPVFNVLTDGQRFVLMQVKGDKLFLEHESRNEEEVLKVRTTKVMESLIAMVEMTLKGFI